MQFARCVSFACNLMLMCWSNILLALTILCSSNPALAENFQPQVSDLFGYIDRTGHFKIAPHYGFCGDFLDGLALIEVRRSGGPPVAGINRNGKAIFVTSERGFSDERRFSNDLLLSRRQVRPMEQSWLLNRVIDSNGHKLHQVIDSSGRLIWQNPPEPFGLKTVDLSTVSFAERDRLEGEKVEKAKSKFLADCASHGLRLKSPPDPVSSHGRSSAKVQRWFSEGLVCVHLIDSDQHERSFFIDEKGAKRFELPKKFFAVGDFHEGRAPVLTKVCEQDNAGDCVEARFGFIDTSGKLVIGCKYRTHYTHLGDIRFSEGLAVVQDEELFGVIDKSGRMVVPFKFSRLTGFHEGLCGANALVDQTGKMYEAASDEVGYQTKAKYLQAYAKALEVALQSLPDCGLVRFDLSATHHQPGISRFMKGTGDGALDQKIRDLVYKTKPPRSGRLMNYGADMAFVLYKRHVYVAFSPADPQYSLILERRKLRQGLYSAPQVSEDGKKVEDLDAAIGDGRLRGLLDHPVDVE